MIIVKNRELLIPNEEYNIGTTYDSNTETRIFQIKRVTSGGVDLANLIFSLDLSYANGKADTCALEKEVSEDSVKLVWSVTKSMLQVLGTVLVQIRGLSADGQQKWTSYKGAFFVEDAINTPGHYEGSLTIIEQIEQDFAVIKKTEADRVNAENAREQAEAKRESDLKNAIDDFDLHKLELKGFAKTSESWAIGGTGTREGEETNNSKYWSEESKKQANEALNSADKAAQYANIVAPKFHIDFNTMELVQEAGAKGINFTLTADKILSYELIA